MEKFFFTQDEARQKINQRMRVVKSIFDLPQESTGIVTYVFNDGFGHYVLNVRFDAVPYPGGYLFEKRLYEKYLVELPPE